MTEKIVNKGFKFRIYPTDEQKTIIEKTFGCCRFIYNNYLQEKNEFYIEHKSELKGKSKEEKNEIYSTFKRTSDKEYGEKYEWMKETSSTARHEVTRHLDSAFKKFFDNMKKNRKVGKKGNKYGFPQFKSKKDLHQSYSDRITQFNWNEKFIVIPKCGKVKFRHKDLPSWWKFMTKMNGTVTISRTPSGNYYASVLFTVENEHYESMNRKDSIGLDFDCDDGYIDSDGKSALKDYRFVKQKQGIYWDSDTETLKQNKTKKKLKRLQRWENRKMRTKSEDSPRKVNSKNREKARIKLAKFEEKIANKRRDWIEKETLRLVKSYDKVVVEDLNYKAMMRNSKNAKNYEDISWSTFVTRLQQKGETYNCNVIKADRFFASSQICHICGYKNKEVQEKHLEEWICPNCGASHQRDVNASINLKNYVPLEQRKLTTVENDYVERLAKVALRVGSFDEAVRCKVTNTEASTF